MAPAGRVQLASAAKALGASRLSPLNLLLRVECAHNRVIPRASTETRSVPIGRLALDRLTAAGRGTANYCLNRRDAFTCFLDDGRVRVSNNAAERKLWAVVVGRRNFDCRRTHERGERGLRSTPLIVSAKLSDIDSRSNLATRRIASSPFPRKEGDQKFRCARNSSRNVSWSLNS
ncbi:MULTISPECIES: IS66 family transposase [unclassified Bradyrhizobium]